MNTTKPINTLIEEFLSEVDCTENTINNYKRTLSIWRDWMIQSADITNPSRADLIRYKKYLMDSREVTTVDSYLSSLKLFFKWMCSKNITEDLAHGIKTTNKNRTHRKKSLSPEQAAMLLDSMKRDYIIRKRNFAIINLMLHTGMRCIEVVRLNYGDMDTLDLGYAIHIQRKGRNEKDAIIEISHTVADPVVEYLNDRNIKSNDDPMFMSHCHNRDDNRITGIRIGRIVKSALIGAGITDKDITAHSLRHTAAQSAIRGNAELYEVQQMLGHKNPETTMIYLRELEKENKQAASAIRRVENVIKTGRKANQNKDLLNTSNS